MSLMRIEELTSLGPVEQDHLQQLEDALHDALLASQLQAQENGLDTERMACAATTLLLALTARSAIDAVAEVTKKEFGALGSDVLGWALDRSKDRPKAWH